MTIDNVSIPSETTQNDSKQVLVLFVQVSSDHLDYLKSKVYALLSPDEQSKIDKYRVPLAAISSLAGKYLLLKGLKMMNFDSVQLTDLKYGEFKRPYISDSIDFNITHSGDLVSCALSKDLTVGLDIEEIQPNSISDFKIVFTPEEVNRIRTAKVPILMFYRLWTQKEAVMKGDGRGFYLSPQKIRLTEDFALAEGDPWYLHSLAMHPAYAAHLAVKVPDDISITMQEVHFEL